MFALTARAVRRRRLCFDVRRLVASGIGPVSRVQIGEISKDVQDPQNRAYVPVKYLTVENDELKCTQNQLDHLRWMLQKDVLGQDMFLLGPPGPNRRIIAMQYLELTQREAEYVALSRDTTEADLKQRREIRGNAADYFDQSAVRAALEGRILILDGIEKAERNVLPVLNNLLENREMHLEDGRFLIPAERYDKLSKVRINKKSYFKIHGEEALKEWRLERVCEDFRIVALGLPVPRYPGNALDPPLRSRFQARHVAPKTYQELLSPYSNLPKSETLRHEQLVGIASTISGLTQPSDRDAEKLPFKIDTMNLTDFPLDSLPAALKIMDSNPHIQAHKVFTMFYPYYSFYQKDSIASVEKIFKAFNADYQNASIKQTVENIKQISNENDPTETRAEIELKVGSKNIKITTPCGQFVNSNIRIPNSFIENTYHNGVIADLIQAHAVSDICIIGPKGCGKSQVAEALGNMLGYTVEAMTLYRDMSARELLQQRETKDNNTGDTSWRPSPLVTGALEGRLVLLDGIHRLHPSTLTVLHRLIQDRELQLYDGTRLLRSDRYDELIRSGYTAQSLNDINVFRIHPAFRMIALTEPPTQGNNWLTPEVLALFSFCQMRNFTKDEEVFIIEKLFGSISKPLMTVIDLAHLLRTSKDATLKNLSESLSTRQLIRIAKRMTNYSSTSAYDIIQHTFLAKFLPNIARNALEKACASCSVSERGSYNRFRRDSSEKLECKIENGTLTIGATTVPIYATESMTKVPDILFYDVPQHVKLLEWLLQDFIMGNHLLLVGNQGVGKNKIADRLLQLLNRPREYIQLHRDTTVHSLTIQPTVKNGIVIYEDSPLVKAVKNGHVLVIDEADKAPTHVTCVLKSLAENGEMILSDGRRIIPNSMKDNYKQAKKDSMIILNEEFRMIVLANRPGFPFLGNDFFASLGDLFSCHAVDNPSIDSELELLKQYGPDVPSEIITKIVKAFSALRNMADQGVVTYPYSTREVVNIVKHLQKYPNDNLASAISNVFDFDHYTTEVIDTLLDVLEQSGLPTKGVLQRKKIQKPIQVTIERKSGLDVSGPKHGKIDPKGAPHVGGNTWAGGTGGRDTAGLGGKGGPYRLDAGHTVHQLSDEEKNDIPDHIKKAARDMNRRAFQDRLKEIRMSEYDAKLYGKFLDAVSNQIGSLRSILSSLQAHNKERQWMRHQTSGDFDDTKLIEGLTGEQAIYKRRVDQIPMPGTPLNRPKRLRLLTDASGSMYRFNSYDNRLDRSLEAVVLVMEALRGFESQLCYDVFAHSGESNDQEIVPISNPPKNEKERLQAIRLIHAHSQFCWPGDNTVSAVELSVKQLGAEMEDSENSNWDESTLVVLSDANLSRYGIPASRLGAALTCHEKVNAHVIFIGSLGDQADSLLRDLPMGRAYICMDVSKLPQILQQIFVSSISNRFSKS